MEFSFTIPAFFPVRHSKLPIVFAWDQRRTSENNDSGLDMHEAVC